MTSLTDLLDAHDRAIADLIAHMQRLDEAREEAS